MLIESRLFTTLTPTYDNLRQLTTTYDNYDTYIILYRCVSPHPVFLTIDNYCRCLSLSPLSSGKDRLLLTTASDEQLLTWLTFLNLSSLSPPN